MPAIIENWRIEKPEMRSRHGLVASQARLGAEAGAGIMAAGGNAVDGAVATAFALASAEPWMSGIGGIGFMVVYIAAERRAYALDFGPIAARGIDPARYPLSGKPASDDLFGWPGVIEDRNVRGYESIAVPGSVDGLGLAHERFGKLAWSELLQPAIKLAEAGHRVDWWSTLNISAEAHDLKDDRNAAAVYLPNGLPPITLDAAKPKRLSLGALPATLKRLAGAGRRDFYEGEIAGKLAADLARGGSKIALADLAAYRATLHDAVEIPYGKATLNVPPGLNAAPTLAFALKQLPKNLAAGDKRPGPKAFLAYAKALAEAYRVRLESMGADGDKAGKGTTTHLSVVDRDGNMVSLTNTLLSRFGSRAVLPETGILMNNGMMWFDPAPGKPNSIGPGKRPLTNMCPLIASRDGAPWFAIGGSGGRKILPAVMQVASFLVDFGMGLGEAFHHPRIDVSAPDSGTMDQRLPPEIKSALSAALPMSEVEATVLPGNFANPIAVLREANGENVGMTQVTLPAATVAAAG
ncbi:MAG: gamma-glutamyltransferase [Proteobacteria bacterium]|nr:gamma-glutamyltransferase [Pseudomonadota bacterium]MBI3499159.1 gamma-glutamyltransferase [Pseudomonadota bacterium]